MLDDLPRGRVGEAVHLVGALVGGERRLGAPLGGCDEVGEEQVHLGMLDGEIKVGGEEQRVGVEVEGDDLLGELGEEGERVCAELGNVADECEEWL